MGSLLIQIHHIHECLKIVCDVEADIFSSNLIAIFKKKNYVGNGHMLQVVSRKLIELHSGLNAHYGNSLGVDQVIDDAKEYIESLVLSTAKLMEINHNLSEKAQGKSYSMGEYNRDLSAFRELQNQYCAIGDRMNANYRLYSHEIALMG